MRKSIAIITIVLLVLVSMSFYSFNAEVEPQGGHQTMIITALKNGKDITIAVSQKGAPYRQEDIKTDKSDGDLGPLLAFIDQQYSLGWKLHSSTMDGGFYYFLLEK